MKIHEHVLITSLGSSLLLYFATFGCPGILERYTRVPANTNSPFVNPKNIEFKVEDKDLDKQKETYVKLKGKEYIFKWDNGEPRLYPYEVKVSTEVSKK